MSELQQATSTVSTTSSSAYNRGMIEVLKVVVWPVTIGIVCIIGLLIFKPAVNGLIGRIHGIKAKDFELKADPAQQSEVKVLESALGEQPIEENPPVARDDQIPPELAKRREEIKKIDVVPIVLEQEQLIRKEIELLKLSQAELPDILIRHLAATQLALRAEIIYRTIFGSQIALLKAVNRFGPKTKDELMVFYNSAKSEYPSMASYPFENYLNYLLTHALLVQEHDKFAITVAGKEFLKYLVDVNANENKPF